MDGYVEGFLLIAGSALVAVAGLIWVRKRIDAQSLVNCHEVGGYLLSIVGTLYAVLLGLIVVDAMSTFQEGRQVVERESNALADIVLLANRMSPTYRRDVSRLAVDYAALVIDREWATMDEGHYAPEARRAALALIDTINGYDPKTEAEKTLHDQQVGCALEMWNSRRSRTNMAGHGIPALKWVVLILGGTITVFFTYFFIVERLKIQALMTALVTVTIALNIYLVMMFGYPFSGDLRVDSSAFRVIREITLPYPGATAR